MRRDVLMALLAAILIGRLPSRSVAEEGKLPFSGDLRGRFDGIWYSDDATGPAAQFEGRLRYRLRLNANATLGSTPRSASG